MYVYKKSGAWCRWHLIEGFYDPWFARRCAIQCSFTTPLKDLDFAYDLALLSDRIQEMRYKARALDEQGAKVGLKINATKTKLLRVGTKRDNGVLIAGEWTNSLTSGVLWALMKKGGTDEDIQARIRKTRQAFAFLNELEIGINKKIRKKCDVP